MDGLARPGQEDGPPWSARAVLTTAAQGQLADIHDRMPLLHDPGRTGPPGSTRTPTDVATCSSRRWSSSRQLELRPVSSKVNNVRNNGPELVAREEPATELDDPQRCSRTQP